MDKIIEWIINNKEWLFSGAGVVIIGAIIGFFLNRGKAKKETASDNSINQSIGSGNTTFGSSKIEKNTQNVNTNPDKPKPDVTPK
jgi:hypothetical protein